MRRHGRSAAWQEQAQSVNRIILRAIARVLQPDQAEGQDTSDGRAIFIRRRRKYSIGFRPAADDASRVRTGNRMMEVRGGRKRLDGFIWKMIGQNPAQPAGKLFALYAARFAGGADRHE